MRKNSAIIKSLVAALGLSAATSLHAANWLMLQGTEPAGASDRARIWGFIQPEYQITSGSEVAAGPWNGQEAVFNQIGPDLESDSQFNIRRARLGVRGTALPIDPRINYFLLAEFGNNGITEHGGSFAKITDASMTLNYIDGARVRIGQFKYPGAEEGLQAIHVFDYINFTNVTNQMLLERFFDYDGSGTRVIPGAPPVVENSGRDNDINGSFGAFRDIGVQVFDTFKMDNWEHSYAAMIGNGNGIARGDNDDNKDYYLYWSSAKIFGGKGPRRDSWKMFGWYHDGRRTLINEMGTGDRSDDKEEEHDRTRWGVGTTFRNGKYRASAEYIKADGMIFNGTDGGTVAGNTATVAGNTALASWNILPEEEADGWYIDLGYKVLPKLELDVRYDVLNRATDNSAAERKFESLTLGAQYFFNKKVRLLANYEIRDAEAPGLSGSANPNKILDDIDDRFSLQLLAVF